MPLERHENPWGSLPPDPLDHIEQSNHRVLTSQSPYTVEPPTDKINYRTGCTSAWRPDLRSIIFSDF